MHAEAIVSFPDPHTAVADGLHHRHESVSWGTNMQSVCGILVIASLKKLLVIAMENDQMSE